MVKAAALTALLSEGIVDWRSVICHYCLAAMAQTAEERAAAVSVVLVLFGSPTFYSNTALPDGQSILRMTSTQSVCSRWGMKGEKSAAARNGHWLFFAVAVI
jgi:hypothetical protein